MAGATCNHLAPVPNSERNTPLDVIRGVALFGVLWVNLLTEFRVSLFDHLFTFHTHQGWLNEWIDLVTAWLIEFKAFTVFSFLFGVGTAVQTDRSASRGIHIPGFLLRRFSILLLIGLVHMFFIWNGDILCLYAVCGILLIPLVRIRTEILVVVGIAAISLTFLPIAGLFIPAPEAMRAHAATSTLIYAHGTFSEILALRQREACAYFVPLLVNAFPKTIGLMLLGIATWRSDVLKHPARHRRFLAGFFACSTAIGALTTSMIFWSASTGKALSVHPSLLEGFSYVPLALGLTAGLTLLLSYSFKGRVVRLFAATGQMALTNYLAQSVIFSLIFYGFGMGLFGQMSPASTAMIGVFVFALQLVASRIWLRQYKFGPAEWLWRSLTYRQFPPMK